MTRCRAVLGAALVAAIPLRASAQAAGHEPEPPTLAPVVITAPADADSPPGAVSSEGPELAQERAAATDSARLLEGVPGVSLAGAGGISSLPVVHGLADERLRVQVDGQDLTSACPNHMNSPLSYIAPAKVARVTVYSGIAPVSVGGDSIGGAIQVESSPPEFASGADEWLVEARGGGFFRSNGRAYGYDLATAIASQNLRLSFGESDSQSENYTAAKSFKAEGVGSLIPGGDWLNGDEVGSSSLEDAKDRTFGLALRREGHLLEFDAGQQTVGFEGFPNQRMDLTANTNTQIGLHYTGQYEWGEIEARVYEQDTRHEMDMGENRFFYGFGMPMKSRATTRNALLHGNVDLRDGSLLRLGVDYQSRDLEDWWPPAGASGSMAPDAFQNIHHGERDRAGLFGEWEAQWSPEWLFLVGARGDVVTSSAGAVSGYNDTMGMWTSDASAFNARDRRRKDLHLDVTALARYLPSESLTLEAGYARKSRSPSLYERYPWSTNAMAALMNNFVGDGNGYIGSLDLEPEVAQTVSASGDWHDAGSDRAWGLRATAYLTRVHDFIDAVRCDFGQCSASNATATTGFVILQYANVPARLHGLDLSGHRLLVRTSDYGSLTATGALSYVAGRNRSSGDDLYHVMPLHGKVGLVHRLGAWTLAAEVQLVASKTHVSDVRNEVPTSSYSLLDLRASYEWKRVRLDLGLENVFDRFYEHPLAGAYLGQGPSMSTGTLPWGVTVPGKGRSLNVALSVEF